MNRIILFLAFAAVSASALTVKESDAKAFNVGKSFLNTLQHLTSDSDYSEVQRKLSNADPEMRNALSKAFVKSDNGESHLSMREVVKAFETISRNNNLSPDAVMSAIKDDPAYAELMKTISKMNVVENTEQVHRVPYKNNRRNH